MNWKESLTKGYKHMTIPRKTVLIFAAVLVLPLLVVTVIWTENQVGKAYRTFETTSASELAQINAGVRSVLSKAGNTITTALDQRNFLTFCNSDMEADGLRLVQFSKNELERMDGIFQSNTQLSGASFYFDNPNVRESGIRFILPRASHRTGGPRSCPPGKAKPFCCAVSQKMQMIALRCTERCFWISERSVS